MTRKPRGVDWSAIWSNKNKCGYYAKCWCAKHYQCCKSYLKSTGGNCWTDPKNLSPEDQDRVADLRKLAPATVKFNLTIGAA